MSINSNNKEHGSPRSNSDVSRRNWGHLLTCLIAAALACSAAGCVDSENEILFKGPLVLKCESFDPPDIKSEGFKEAPYLAGVFKINLAESASGFQTFGYDKDRKDNAGNPDPGYVSIVVNGVEFSAGVSNTLGPTTNYTKLGIGSELRIDQNGVALNLMEIEVTEAPDDFPGELEISNKPISVVLGSSTSTAASGFKLLNLEEVQAWNDAIVAAGMQGVVFRLTLGIQLSGNLISDYPISSSKIYMPIEVCSGTQQECGFGTTPLCSSSK